MTLSADELSVIQERVRDYDDEYWAHLPGLPTLRHTVWHLDTAGAKLSAYLEQVGHDAIPDPTQIRQEVIPDLLIHAARLTNNLPASYYSKLALLGRVNVTEPITIGAVTDVALALMGTIAGLARDTRFASGHEPSGNLQMKLWTYVLRLVRSALELAAYPPFGVTDLPEVFEDRILALIQRFGPGKTGRLVPAAAT